MALIALLALIFLTTVPYAGLRNELSRGRPCPLQPEKPQPHPGKMINESI